MEQMKQMEQMGQIEQMEQMELDRADRADRSDGADRAGGEYKVLEAVKVVRTCQNLSGQDGTCLGFLLHIGPNGDRFGGQAFMEHYTRVSLLD
jgi:hypothetical protein